MPGCLGAAKNTCHISPTAISEGVYASSELSCYLKRKEQIQNDKRARIEQEQSEQAEFMDRDYNLKENGSAEVIPKSYQD